MTLNKYDALRGNLHVASLTAFQNLFQSLCCIILQSSHFIVKAEKCAQILKLLGHSESPPSRIAGRHAVCVCGGTAVILSLCEGLVRVCGSQDLKRRGLCP